MAMLCIHVMIVSMLQHKLDIWSNVKNLNMRIRDIFVTNVTLLQHIRIRHDMCEIIAKRAGNLKKNKHKDKNIM